MEKTRVECLHCNGTGVCTRVDGASCDTCLSVGTILKYGFVDHKRKTVQCSKCKGEGYKIK